jgi:hypothetical protein
MFRLIALSVIVALATPVVAAPDAPAPAPAVSRVVKDKKICRAENSTGSIMPKRTCRTQAEWSALDIANRDSVQQRRDRQTMGAPVPGSH